MRPHSVTSYAELGDRIARLQRDNPLLVFRGQTRLRKGVITPSLARAGADDATHRTWMIMVIEMLADQTREYLKWKSSREEGHDSTSDAPASEHRHDSYYQALLQHYGAPSDFVDVTKSLDVALWFAHHKYQLHETPLMADDASSPAMPEPFGPIMIFDRAHYEPAWKRGSRAFGYLFAFAPARPAPDTLHHGDYIDLTAATQQDSRMLRQQAGLLYADKALGGGALAPKAIVRFRLPLNGTPTWVRDPDATRLFPPPNVDDTLASILRTTPFADVVDQPVTVRRVLRIPEYAKGPFALLDEPEWLAHRACDHYIRPTFFFAFLARSTNPQLVHQLGDETFRLRDAAAILSPKPSSHLIVRAPREPIPFRVTPQDSIVLEYPAFQLALAISRSKYVLKFWDGKTIAINVFAWPNIRAVWIIRREDQYWCRIFGKDPQAGLADITVSLGHAFRFLNGELTLVGKTRKGSEDAYHANVERSALLHTLGALAEVVEGKRLLVPAEFRPYLLLR
ncbi:MAG TPA: FRG domain-containing protein [Thermoanaerobaculia bacterium]|jgi:hypothetical protein|nr:FRG domain-containing protein [Thermoanaerobaculia bacterium]